MKKFLITGVSGFVGQHFVDYLEINRINAHVLGVDLVENRSGRAFSYVTQSFEQLNLLGGNKIERLLFAFTE